MKKVLNYCLNKLKKLKSYLVNLFSKRKVTGIELGKPRNSDEERIINKYDELSRLLAESRFYLITLGALSLSDPLRIKYYLKLQQNIDTIPELIRVIEGYISLVNPGLLDADTFLEAADLDEQTMVLYALCFFASAEFADIRVSYQKCHMFAN